MKLTPRSYQQQAADQIKLSQVNMLVLPQRSGKSFIMALAIDQYKFKKVLIIVGYRKIVEQLASYFPDEHTFILAGQPFDHTKRVHLASFQTLANRDIDLSEYDVIIQDEAHSRTSKRAQGIVFQPNTTILLFTGTPLTNTNKLMTKNIDNFIQPITVKELIDNNWLTPTRFLSNGSILGDNAKELLNKKQDYDEDIVKQLIKKEDLLQNILDLVDKDNLDTEHKTLIYVNYISTADELYQVLKHRNNVAVIHSKMTNKEQQDVIENYQQSDAGILINIRSLSLGFDSPTTDRLILAVLSKIDSLLLQIMWRASTINPADSSKTATVYDMVGVLTGKLNPYTDFKKYSKKLPCQEECAKQFPEDLLQQYFCLESCKSDGPLSICNGKLSSNLVNNPFISDYQVIEGIPCKGAIPLWDMKYKTKDAGVGKLYKYSKCICGLVTRYTVTTTVAPSEMIELYDDDTRGGNCVTVIYSRKHKKAIALFDDVSKTRYKIIFFNSSGDMYETAVKYFKGKKFTLLSNIAMPKLANVTIDRSLDSAEKLVNWESESTSGFVKKLIKAKMMSIVHYFGDIKEGWVYFASKGITKDNEKQTMNFLIKENMSRYEFLTYFKKLNESNQ